jgi:hypothetical protein
MKFEIMTENGYVEVESVHRPITTPITTPITEVKEEVGERVDYDAILEINTAVWDGPTIESDWAESGKLVVDRLASHVPSEYLDRSKHIRGLLPHTHTWPGCYQPTQEVDDISKWVVSNTHRIVDERVRGYQHVEMSSPEAHTRYLDRLETKKVWCNYRIACSPPRDADFHKDDVLNIEQTYESQSEIDIKETEYFEKHALFAHQNEVFGDISERAVKIGQMSFSERDRFMMFSGANAILQRRFDLLIPEMNDPKTWMETVGYMEEGQALRLIEAMKIIEPTGSKVKREIMERIALTMVGGDGEANHDQIERSIDYLKKLANPLVSTESGLNFDINKKLQMVYSIQTRICPECNHITEYEDIVCPDCECQMENPQRFSAPQGIPSGAYAIDSEITSPHYYMDLNPKQDQSNGAMWHMDIDFRTHEFAHDRISKQLTEYKQRERYISYGHQEWELSPCATSDEDALNHAEPFGIEECYYENADGTYRYIHESLTHEDFEESMSELSKQDKLVLTSEFVNRSVYDEGNGNPYLTQKEFDRLLSAIDSCKDLNQLSTIATWLYENEVLSFEQSKILWPPMVFGLRDTSPYRLKKQELIQKSLFKTSPQLKQVRDDLNRAEDLRSVKYIGAWLYAQFGGQSFNKIPANPAFASLDKIQKQKIWKAFKERKLDVIAESVTA